ncbi:MAG: hypothetical protein JW818_12825 [Pirellulales bacterium]|nr:hypothetical protein [Pirellulales bacterium]
MTCAPLLLAAQEHVQSHFEWGRIETNTDWILPVGVCILILVFVRLLYQKDSRELGPVLGWLLTILRSLAFFVLLVLYLQPGWRYEQERQVHSRALVLVDTSLSMGLSDDSTGASTRADQVINQIGQTDFLQRLRQRNDVSLFRFGRTLEPIVTLDRLPEEGEAATQPEKNKNASDKKGEENAAKPAPPDWKKVLAPLGTETRLGEALRRLLIEEQGAPLSGVIVITDGGQNAGINIDAAVAAAHEAGVPIYPIGIGSAREAPSVRVSDFIVPARAFPGDQYPVTAYIQAQKMAGKVLTVELSSQETAPGESAPGMSTPIESREITLGADGEVVPVRFDLSPKELGRQTLTVTIQAPADDRNTADNRREADIEIVDRKTRVLLLAGGPSREYRFLRNMLFRDKSVTVDILLQTAQPGISQDANAVLDDFPATREEMFEYDCVVALDPDWQAFSVDQLNLLESWVAEQGGGLIAEAGPVNMGNPITGWIQTDEMSMMRNLYPVVFNRRFAIEMNNYASEQPWPLEFTREGLEAPFLWLGDDAVTSEEAWSRYPGVYSCYPVRESKRGATVLATYSDPEAAAGQKPPIYMASQFYGSGRVLYLGSAEMWRLRAVDDTFFEVLYTKMIRHVSQGRLLRGSSRGTLLVGQERCVVGSTIEIRAQLTDSRLEPLAAPRVLMQVIAPDNTIQTITLQPDTRRVGTFVGQATAQQEGVYRLELPVPESADERLTRRVQVKMPDLEREHPQRNDALLTRLANGTKGKYYVGVADGLAATGPGSVAAQLIDKTKTVITPIAPDRESQREWLRWVIGLVCGLLFVEWTIRRLVRLA